MNGKTMFDLSGKVCLVTGANRGLGRAIAIGLAEAGGDVVVACRDKESGRAVAREIEALGRRALVVPCDIGRWPDLENLVGETCKTFGRIDVLVNNAAIARPLKLVDTEPDVFDQIYRVNQLGVFLGMRAVVPAMRDAGGGSIINISSVAGVRGTSTLFAYTSTKWAVRGMTKSAALELARFNIRVNVIFPGVIDTPMNDGNPAHMNEVLVRSTPMRRMGRPEEVAEAVLFLASPNSSFATGAELAIDGGMSI